MQAMQLSSNDDPSRPVPAGSPVGKFVAALAQITLLAAVLAGVLGVIAFQAYGTSGVASAFIAIAACHLGIVAALAYTEAVKAFDANPMHVLAAMGFRFLLPLAVCVVAAVGQSWVVEAGFGYWLVAAYLVLLVGQIWIDVRRSNSFGKQPAVK